MFGSIKEGIVELVDECLGSFHVKLTVGQLEARIFTFGEYHACGAPEFFGEKAPSPLVVGL